MSHICKNVENMQSLYNTFRILLSLTPTNYIRTFHDSVDWDNRLICLMGQKGVGKSTMLLQHIIKYDNLDETLYVQADDPYFSGHTLFDLAYEFFSLGGKKLYIDEIHKCPDWSRNVKKIYDQLPLIKLVYSGSSLLALAKGDKADLSRRAIEYTMPPLSFREYLNIRNGWKLKPASLSEILTGKVDFPRGEERPLRYYMDYCKTGFYPFFNEKDALIRLKQAINVSIEEDIPRYAEMTVAAAYKLKKLMYVLAKSVPFKPVCDTLGRDLQISRNTIPDYLMYLEQSGLFNVLREPGHSDTILSKIEKLYLGNSNISFCMSEDGNVDEGTLRETNFLTWMKQAHQVTSSKISDFEIDGITFEVGGKNKKGRQIKDAKNGYVVKDNLEYGIGNVVPIWMFGFIY